MEFNWQEIVQISSIVLGSGGMLSLLYAKRERKAAAQEKEANASLLTAQVAEVSQKVYKGIIEQLQNEVRQLKEEVFMLRSVVESYKETCENCPNNKKKLKPTKNNHNEQ